MVALTQHLFVVFLRLLGIVDQKSVLSKTTQTHIIMCTVCDRVRWYVQKYNRLAVPSGRARGRNIGTYNVHIIQTFVMETCAKEWHCTR